MTCKMNCKKCLTKMDMLEDILQYLIHMSMGVSEPIETKYKHALIWMIEHKTSPVFNYLFCCEWVGHCGGCSDITQTHSHW